MTHHHEEQHAEELWEDDGGKPKHVADPALSAATQAALDAAARQASALLGGVLSDPEPPIRSSTPGVQLPREELPEGEEYRRMISGG